MTSLLTRPSTATRLDEPGERRTPLVRTAVLAGLAAAGSGLAVTVVLALAGWFAADAGRYGDTRDAVRVGADAWLLAHGAGLRLDGGAVSVLPLGLTLLFACFSFRAGAWAARRAGSPAEGHETATMLTLAGLHATSYGLVALGAAVLAVHPAAEAGLLRALAGGFVLAAVSGGAGTAVAGGLHRRLGTAVPLWGWMVLRGAAGIVLLMLAASGVLVTAALAVDLNAAANVLAGLQLDPSSALMYTLVGLAFVPNALLFGVAYLLGPGFAVGAGTVVSPTAVVLGPLPAFPLLAALPDSADTPVWATWLLGVPVLLSVVGVVLMRRGAPVPRLDVAGLAGLGAGLLAALVLTLLALLAGGAAGPGRMASVGTPVLAVLPAAALACGGGGLVGGLLAGWWTRRRTASAGEGDDTAR